MPPMEKRRESRVLTRQQIARLLVACDEQLRAILLLGLLPGLRIGEIHAPSGE